jgi:RimJ/RimL family protein N-acetyltransferase
VSVIQPDNAASIRVAEKLGEQFERKAEVSGHAVVIYGIRRQDRGHSN